MRHEIRQSEDKSFYYLLSIDDEGNETVLAENSSLSEVQAHPAIEGQSLRPVAEEDTRDVFVEPEQPEEVAVEESQVEEEG